MENSVEFIEVNHSSQLMILILISMDVTSAYLSAYSKDLDS